MRDVSYAIFAGQTLAVVGESGCGKSVTALSILRLIPSPPGRVLSGQIRFAGRDLLALAERDMRRVRGGDAAMIFQEPMTSLNPVYTVGDQIVEAVTLHQGVGHAGGVRDRRAGHGRRRHRRPRPAGAGVPAPDVRAACGSAS